MLGRPKFSCKFQKNYHFFPFGQLLWLIGLCGCPRSQGGGKALWCGTVGNRSKASCDLVWNIPVISRSKLEPFLYLLPSSALGHMSVAQLFIAVFFVSAFFRSLSNIGKMRERLLVPGKKEYLMPTLQALNSFITQNKLAFLWLLLVEHLTHVKHTILGG